MSNEAYIVTLLSCTSVIVSGFAAWAVKFRPDLGKKIIKIGKVPWAPWTMRPEADPILRMSVYVGFLVFLVFACVIAYGWLRYALGVYF